MSATQMHVPTASAPVAARTGVSRSHTTPPMTAAAQTTRGPQSVHPQRRAARTSKTTVARAELLDPVIACAQVVTTFFRSRLGSSTRRSGPWCMLLYRLEKEGHKNETVSTTVRKELFKKRLVVMLKIQNTSSSIIRSPTYFEIMSILTHTHKGISLLYVQ